MLILGGYDDRINRTGLDRIVPLPSDGELTGALRRVTVAAWG